MASTKIIIARVPKSDQTKTVNMFPASRKAQILQRMAAAADASLGLKPSAPATTCTKMSLPDENPAPRKRQRLTHLTPEEKMMRRKLKNRVAAQTARDRKKAQMDNLETSVGVTATLNKQLQMENALLRKQNQMLLAENKELKERLQVKKEDDTQSVVVLDHGYCLENVPSPPVSPPAMQLAGKPEVVVESPEPAVFNSPPQQEMARLFLTFLSTLLTWSLTTSFWDCSAGWARPLPTEKSPSSPRTQTAPSAARHIKQEEPLCLVTRKTSSKQDSNSGHQAWWGPQQRSWNPSKN